MDEHGEKTYGERLKEAMGGMSVQTLADKLGVTYQAVKKLLDGNSKGFSVLNHYAAADFLKVDPRWLATGQGPKLPPEPQGMQADWRTIALMTARRHPHEHKRIELLDFIQRVDEDFEAIQNPTISA